MGLRASSLRWGEFDPKLRIKEGRRHEASLLFLLHDLIAKPVPTFADRASPEFFGTEKHIWLQQRIPIAEMMKQFPELFSITETLKDNYKVMLRNKS